MSGSTSAITFVIIFAIFVIVWENVQCQDAQYGHLIWRKRSKHTYLQFDSLSILECGKECLTRRKRCVSINYSYTMSFCELNHKISYKEASHSDEENGKFVYSEISSWSKKLIGGCQNIDCAENQVCQRNGSCVYSDCGEVNITIPDKAKLKYYGSHEVGNGVEFECTGNHVMYNKQTGERLFAGYVICGATGQWSDVNFVCKACDIMQLHGIKNSKLTWSSWTNQTYEFTCNAGYQAYNEDNDLINGNIIVTCDNDGKWQGLDFFCKDTYAKPVVRDFCLFDYWHDEDTDICYKDFFELLNQDEAKKACLQEQAHLLSVINNSTRDFVNYYSDALKISILVDGFWEHDEWRSWTKQIITFFRHIQGNANQSCIASVNGTLSAVSCTVPYSFICQLEVCPESAGYTWKQNLCYKTMQEREYDNNICAMNTALPYNPKVMERASVSYLLNSTSLQIGGTAYVLNPNIMGQEDALKKCQKDDMFLAILDTKEKREIAAVITKSEDVVWTGLQLDPMSTFHYKTSDGETFPFVNTTNVIKTDTRKCLTFSKKNHMFDSRPCSEKRAYLCTTKKSNYSKEDIIESQNRATFGKAVDDCKARERNLIEIISESSLSVVKEFLNEERHYTNFYVDAQLHNRKYTYKWNDGQIAVNPDFGKDYDNDTKDTYRGATFMLSRTSHSHPMLCQTRNDVMWIDGANANEVANTLDKTLNVKRVHRRNKLPYICQI